MSPPTMDGTLEDTSRPRVSVIIPTYNRRALLERAVRSVLGQTHGGWELLIVDDGSSDDTAVFASDLARSDARIRILRNSHRRKGPAGARNAGIEASTGDMVAFLDSDDTWLPTKLQDQLAFFDAHPQAMALGSDCYVGGTSESNRLSLRYETLAHSREAIFRAIINQKQFWIYTPTVMVRREVFDAVGLFKEELVRCEDLVMWLLINQRWEWHYLPVPLAVINTNPDRNKDYDRDRHVAEGYYHMLFIRDLGLYIPLEPDAKRALRSQQRTPDYLYWRGRDKLTRRDPTGLIYYAGALFSAAVGRLRD